MLYVTEDDDGVPIYMVTNNQGQCIIRTTDGYIAMVLNAIGVEEINYRLGHDDDRQKSNYFIKNENGHVNNKKSKMQLCTCKSKKYYQSHSTRLCMNTAKP